MISSQIGAPAQAKLSAAVPVAAKKSKPFLLVASAAALLIPIFWSPQIEAGDLGSHLYNAWLTTLLHGGKAPGLWIAPQTTNILFDSILDWLLPLAGTIATARIAVGLAVLIFFAGSFSLVAALAEDIPFSVIPLLAMLAYSRIFELGFFNFYLSAGLSCLALAVFLRRKSTAGKMAGACLLAIAWLAHPVPVLGSFAILIFIALRRFVTRRVVVATAIGIAIAALAGFLYSILFTARHLRFHFLSTALVSRFFSISGLDSFRLFDHSGLASYRWIEIGLLLIILLLFLRKKDQRLTWNSLPLQLYLLAALVALLSPRNIVFGRFQQPMGFLGERIALMQCIFGCAIVAILRPARWHRLAILLVCVAYFVLLYSDSRRLNAIDSKLQQLVATVPERQRVLGMISYPGARELSPLAHMLDRDCIGHCFSYANYEPATLEFRLRARPGNGMVTSDVDDSVAMQEGTYVVKPQDLPIYQIYPCGPAITDLCLRSLHAGELNGVAPEH